MRGWAMIATILLLCPALLLAADKPKPEPSDKHLVEVTYYYYLATAAPPRHIEMTHYISEHSRGWVSDDPIWARMEGSERDGDTATKATACKELLTALEQPKILPEDPAQIVTVRCTDGDEWIARKFPIDKVPIAVRWILIAMGFSNDSLKSLTFIPKGA